MELTIFHNIFPTVILNDDTILVVSILRQHIPNTTVHPKDNNTRVIFLHIFFNMKWMPS